MSADARPRVAAVSFLNSKPLLAGLDAEVELYLDIPSRLAAGLADGSFDVALLPVADIATISGARVVTWPGTGNEGEVQAGGIACDGPTLTVRIFADRPLDRLTTLHCDTDSHTSVQLARVLLAERFGVLPALVPLPRNRPYPTEQGLLLIGDKVITAPPDPARFPVQHDLGAEWKAHTGQPFVFAAWTAGPQVDPGRVAPALAAALSRGLASLADLACAYAPRHGWPVELALTYYTQYLRYRLTGRELSAMALFQEKARRLPAMG